MKKQSKNRSVKESDFIERHPRFPLVISIIALLVAIIKPILEKMI